MTNDYFFYDTGDLSEVLSMVFIEDEASYTVDFRYDAIKSRLWIVRGLKNRKGFLYIECFEFMLQGRCWGVRAWSEEDVIPYIDCPLELISLTDPSVDSEWRRMVYTNIAAPGTIPNGAWLHCGPGLMGNRSGNSRYIQKTESGFFDLEGKAVKLTPDLISAFLLEGRGIAHGIA